MNSPKVAIITVISNSSKWLEAYLWSVQKTDYSNHFIIFFDNASQDNGVELILQRKKDFKCEIDIFRSNKNLGFAEANNIAIKKALQQGADYVMLLNPDIKVEHNWLNQLIKLAATDKTVGIISPLQYDYDGSKINDLFLKIFDYKSSIFNDIKNNTLRDKYEAKTVVGAAMLIKKSVFDKIGFFDTLYFLYGEEFDFCRLALYHHFKIYVVTKSVIYHWGSLSHKHEMTERKKYYYTRSCFLYILKDPAVVFPKLIYGYFFIDSMYIAKKHLLFKNLQSLIIFMRIQLWIIFHLPIILIRRWRV